MKTPGVNEVHDQIVSTSPHIYTEVLHTDTKFTPDGERVYSTELGGATLDVRVILPQQVESKIEPYIVMGPGRPGSVHGSVFEFHRETNFNATSHGQASKTPLHINNFGATLGGPIIKDKTFLFGSYGGLRQVNPVGFNTVVPDALQRAGNFSENLPTTPPASGLGACATALNAADKANTAYGGKFFVCDPVTHQPIPGNRADLDTNYKNLMDPVAAAVLSQNVPLPTAGRTDNRYIGNMGLPNETNEFLVKGDQQLGPSHRLTLNYFQ